MSSASVRVALRVRPLSPQEQVNGESECVTQLPGVPQIVIGADRAFTFDHVFAPEVTQEQVYEDAVLPLVRQFLKGYNATVLAYGQTGSGKTFSMGTGLSTSSAISDTQGVVPRAIGDIWTSLEKRATEDNKFSYSLEVSFMELYNEDMIDLLNPRLAIAGSRGPSIREDSRGNMVLVGVERKAASSQDEIISFLHQGTLSRTTASTDMNRTSSRSHAIFTVILRQQGRRSAGQAARSGESPASDHMTLDNGPLMISKMHFVDLAGSERIKRTGAAGTRVKEGISINAGLLALGNVISALGNGTQPGKRQTHVPYRDSKLTRLLQDSLGGNSQTLMLACISPSNKNHAESLNTIRYANRARNIRNKVAVNFDKNSSAELSILKTEVARLRGEIAKLKLLRRQSSLMPSDQAAGQTMARLEAELSRLEAVNMEITEKLEQAVRQAAVLEIERDSLRRKIVDLGGTVDTKMADSAIAMLDSSLLKYPGAAVPMGSVGNSTPSGIQSPRPNSIFTDGNPGILSDQMLNTMDRELSDQAERHEQQIDSVRHHYESKLELLQETLAIVQKERDVALQRLANANKSSASLSSGSNGPPNRRVLGLENGTSTPTKLRQPSRIAKASVSRKSSSVDIPGRSSPVPVVRELQEQLEQLRRENQALLDNAAADSESLALQVQEQAREIATLRRKRTGRTDSRRFSFLPHRDNTWGVARDVAEEENTPNLLRAAFIKKVLEGELQRCVQARQMLRERDSYLSKQDELMNEQNDMMLLQLQGDDIDGDHDPSDEPANPASPGTTMEWANQRIEIIDAELHYLDLKVRDVEAEIARLSEDTTESASDLQGSGLLSRPLLLNMSGLAMRMVEDVVRIDYRAFADMFDAMEPKDVTGLSYLLMQDIIDLRLMSHREEIARKELEEQTMDLRRTLLVMQKTAVNAALSYEHELGNAERRLSLLKSPEFAPSVIESVGDDHIPQASPPRDISQELAHTPIHSTLSDQSRSVYDNVRERGILLRSAILSAGNGYDDDTISTTTSYSPRPVMVAPPVKESDSSQASLAPFSASTEIGSLGSASGNDTRNQLMQVTNRDASVSLANSTPVVDSRTSGDSAFFQESVKSISISNMARSPSPIPEVPPPPPPSAVTAQTSIIQSTDSQPTTRNSNSSEQSTRIADSKDFVVSSAALSSDTPHSSQDPSTRANSAQLNRISSYNSPIESDYSLAATNRALRISGTFGRSFVDVGQFVDDMDGMFMSDPEDMPSEVEPNIIYRSGSSEFFRQPNMARNPSTRSRHRSRHLVRRSQKRNDKTRQPHMDKATMQHLRISLPIVPPEMMEYIDQRNPTALRVSDHDAVVASPEILKQMNIPDNAEYHENIAAFSSFAVKKPAVSTPATPTTPSHSAEGLANNGRAHQIPPCRQPRGDHETSSESESDFRDAPDHIAASIPDDSARPSEDVNEGFDDSRTKVHFAQPADNDSDSSSRDNSPVQLLGYHRLRSPGLMPTRRFPGSPQSRYSYPSTADSNEQVFNTLEHDMRSSLVVTSAENLLSDNYEGDVEYTPRLDDEDHTALYPPRVPSKGPNVLKPLPHRPVSKPVPPRPKSPEKPAHRFLSPTEQVNASLFSMIDAAKIDPAELQRLREKQSVQTTISSKLSQEQFLTKFGDDYDSCAHLDPEAQAMENSIEESMQKDSTKPMKIRRRAHSSNADEESPIPTSKHKSNNRLTKLLSGIGLGSSGNGQKPKEQTESQLRSNNVHQTHHAMPAEPQNVDKNKKRLPELPTEFNRAFSNDIHDLPLPRIQRNRSQSDSSMNQRMCEGAGDRNGHHYSRPSGATSPRSSDKYMASPIARQRHAAHRNANSHTRHSHAFYLNEPASSSMGNTNKALPNPPTSSPDTMYGRHGMVTQTYYEY